MHLLIRQYPTRIRGVVALLVFALITPNIETMRRLAGEQFNAKHRLTIAQVFTNDIWFS